MKIAPIVSGILIIVMSIMLFTGLINFDNSIIKFLVRGNRLFADSNYEQALNAYNEGLKKDSENLKLNYNSGQAAYLLEDYQNAVMYFDKACDTPERYLNSGNSSLKLGDNTEDVNQKKQYYKQALDTYKKGILAFPENVPLKYNYEYVKKKLEELDVDNSENRNDEENKDENEENQENQSQDGKQNGQDNSQQQNEDEQGNSSQSGDEDQKDETQQDSTKQNQNQSEGQQSGQDKDNNQDEKSGAESKEEHGDGKNGNEEDKNDAGYSPESEGSDSQEGEIDDSLLQQVLRMLERQEEEALKNNQEVRNKGEEDEYDW